MKSKRKLLGDWLAIKAKDFWDLNEDKEVIFLSDGDQSLMFGWADP
jgi:hypothetical protein